MIAPTPATACAACEHLLPLVCAHASLRQTPHQCILMSMRDLAYRQAVRARTQIVVAAQPSPATTAPLAGPPSSSQPGPVRASASAGSDEVHGAGQPPAASIRAAAPLARYSPFPRQTTCAASGSRFLGHT